LNISNFDVPEKVNENGGIEPAGRPAVVTALQPTGLVPLIKVMEMSYSFHAIFTNFEGSGIGHPARAAASFLRQ